MESIKFHFSNIQSHEDTIFSLAPGLNFILADDNNVGKSTIFKAITVMSKMPRIVEGDLQEMLRGGASTGYISAEFSDMRVTFWLHREDGNKVRAFFEVVEAGISTRSASCPSCLLDALDIVLGSDGLPININDADSVQLIVQDTAKNDEVLAKVLIDTTVDDIKQNATALSKQVQQDYKVVNGRLTDSSSVLATMHYNDAVDAFFEEQEFLYSLVRVTDCFADGCSLDNCIGQQRIIDKEVDSALTVLIHLLGIPEFTTCSILQEFDSFNAGARVLKEISSCDLHSLCGVPQTDFQRKSNKLIRAVDILELLRKVEISTGIINNINSTLKLLSVEEEQLRTFMMENYRIIKCPVKGEVFYGDTECVPTDAGFTF